MLVFVEAAFDDVATLVVLDVVADRSSAARTTTLAMALLVGRLGDDGDDAAVAQVLTDRARRVCLVAADPVGAGAWPARASTLDAEVFHQDGEHRGIAGLAGTDEHDQWEPASVDEVVDLRAQTTT